MFHSIYNNVEYTEQRLQLASHIIQPGQMCTPQNNGYNFLSKDLGLKQLGPQSSCFPGTVIFVMKKFCQNKFRTNSSFLKCQVFLHSETAMQSHEVSPTKRDFILLHSCNTWQDPYSWEAIKNGSTLPVRAVSKFWKQSSFNTLTAENERNTPILLPVLFQEESCLKEDENSRYPIVPPWAWVHAISFCYSLLLPLTCLERKSNKANCRNHFCMPNHIRVQSAMIHKVFSKSLPSFYFLGEQ